MIQLGVGGSSGKCEGGDIFMTFKAFSIDKEPPSIK